MIGYGVPSPLQLGDGSSSLPTFSFRSDPDTGLFLPASNSFGVAAGGAYVARFAASALNLLSTYQFSWGSGNPSTAGDTVLFRSAAGVVGVTSAIALGSNPAASGSVRIPNNSAVSARNLANSADLPIAKVNTSDSLEIGGASNPSIDLLAPAVLIYDSYIQGTERGSDPSAPAAGGFRLYAKDNGAGKTQLVVLFNSGAVQVLATEP